jgi:2-polyprenyl-3-methyl-5-hydroxy-6-metoxy-1,4-benzoquinol methylase
MSQANLHAEYYDRFYYETYAFGQAYRPDNPHWRDVFDRIAETIVLELAPQSVLDAGCGPGLLVDALRHRHIEAWGVDVSEYAIENAAPDARPYCRVGSVTEPLERQYDLIVSIEVLEHVPRELADRAVENLARHATSTILFSSSPDDLRDPSHLNVRPQEYWAGLFGRHGFFRDLTIDAGFVSPHALVLRRLEEGPLAAVRAYEREHVRIAKELKEMREVNVLIVEDRAVLTAQVERLQGAPMPTPAVGPRRMRSRLPLPLRRLYRGLRAAIVAFRAAAR